MNKQTEALKMAIEALEMHVPYYIKDKGCDALIACKEALEQPAQEPVAIVTGHIEISLLSDTINKMLPINTELYTHPAPSSYQSNSKLSYSEELAYQAGFEAGREFERGCDD